MRSLVCSTPFCFSDKLFLFTGAPMGSAGPALPQSLTNAQKLALPSNTTVGTQVAVSDGFVVSGSVSSLENTFYFPTGNTVNGKPSYANTNGRIVSYDGTQWTDSDGGTAQPGNENHPWEADFTTNTRAVLTNPAIQQLSAPSSAQGAVFVSGGTQDGIYTDRSSFEGNLNGKKVFGLLGTSDTDVIDNQINGIQWIAANVTPSVGSAGFAIFDGGGGNALYYSLSGVATPDLASNWKNASDDSPASITVTSVTQGELDAGLAITNDGVTNGSSHVTQPFHGRQYYMGLNGGGSNNLHWDTTYNVWTDDVGEWTADNVAFPWQGTDAHSSHNGAAFARNDVAAEANWENV